MHAEFKKCILLWIVILLGWFLIAGFEARLKFWKAPYDKPCCVGERKSANYCLVKVHFTVSHFKLHSKYDNLQLGVQYKGFYKVSVKKSYFSFLISRRMM